MGLSIDFDTGVIILVRIFTIITTANLIITALMGGLAPSWTAHRSNADQGLYLPNTQL